MLNHLRIGVRLGLGFAVALLLLIVIAVIGITRVGALKSEITDLVKDKNVKVKLANDMIENINAGSLAHRRMLIMKNDEATRTEAAEVAGARRQVGAAFDSIDKFSFSVKGKPVLEEARVAYQSYLAAALKLEALIKAKQWDEAIRHFDDAYQESFMSANNAIDAFIVFQTELAETAGEEAEALALSTRNMIIGFAAAALLCGIACAVLITRSITGPTAKLLECTAKMARGDFDFELAIDSRDEVGALATAMRSLQSAVRAMKTDAELLTRAAVEGKLAVRADAAKHQGEYQKIVMGVNETLDAVIGPLNVAADYVAKISLGNIPAPISEAYHGDFNTIKNNLNACIEATDQQAKAAQAIARGDLSAVVNIRSENDVLAKSLVEVIQAINALVADASYLSQATVDGNLDARIDVSRHQGYNRKVVEGLNAVMVAVSTPVCELREVLGAMEGGDLSTPMRKHYEGTWDELKSAVNNMLDKLAQVVTDVNAGAHALAAASEEVSATAQSLSQAASEQAASVEETSASVEQMTS